MNCQTLAAKIESIQPGASPEEVARLCLLLTNSVDDLDELGDEATLGEVWRQAGLKLQAATDQHNAMTQELEELAAGNPRDFSQDQIWVLIRAIKVQSQVLRMYIGQELDV
jgi:hypothetical protein